MRVLESSDVQDKLSILFVNTLYYPFSVGGAEVSVQILAEELAKSGHKVGVLTLTSERCISCFRHNEVTIYQIPIKNIYWPFYNIKRDVFSKVLWHFLDIYNPFYKNVISKIVKSVEPDVVHTNNLSGFSVSVWRYVSRLRIPIVHTSRDYYLIHPNGVSTQLPASRAASSMLFLAAWIKRRHSVAVDLFSPISTAIGFLHKKNGFFLLAPTKVIHNAVSPSNGNVPRTIHAKNELTIGFIGRVAEHKGIEILVRAFSMMERESTLIIAGQGESGYVNYIKANFRDHRINYMGHLDPAEFYPLVDVVVIPSLWEEPFGRIALEAYTFGKPVICSKIGGLVDIVVDGETGFLVEPGDVAGLAFLLDELNRHDLVQMKDAIFKHLGRFSIAKIVVDHEESYVRVLRNDPRDRS